MGRKARRGAQEGSRYCFCAVLSRLWVPRESFRYQFYAIVSRLWVPRGAETVAPRRAASERRDSGARESFRGCFYAVLSRLWVPGEGLIFPGANLLSFSSMVRIVRPPPFLCS